jgi:RHS repeat-associated protein
MTDNSGALQNHIGYDGFGKVASESSPSFGDRYKFTGREYNADVGLYDYRARPYNAPTGRFTVTDLLGFSAGDVNLYRYVGNGPTNTTDPSGLASWRTVGFQPRQVVRIAAAVTTLLPALGRAVVDLDTYLRRGTPSIGSRIWFSRFLIDYFTSAAHRRYNDISDAEIRTIRNVLKQSLDAFDSGDVVFYYSRSTDNIAGYVNIFNRIYLTEGFFAGLNDDTIRAKRILHEITHAFANTDDYGYVLDETEYPPRYLARGGERRIDLSSQQLQDNADTYAVWVFAFYMWPYARFNPQAPRWAPPDGEGADRVGVRALLPNEQQGLLDEVLRGSNKGNPCQCIPPLI